MSNSVWIVLQQRDGKLHRMSVEAIAAGQQLASAVGGTAEAVLLGSNLSEIAEQVASYDLATVHVIESPTLADYTPGAFVGALAPAIEAAAPAYVILPHTYQSVDYMARLAQAVDAGLLPEVTAFSGNGEDLTWSRPILGGKMTSSVRVRGEGTVLLSVQSGAFSADSVASGSATVEAMAAPADLTADREILEIEAASSDQIDLTKASVIVAVGRGVGGPEKLAPLEELAQALGADIGASRPVIDNGWLDRDRQIGSSGQTVTPKLYLAIGISGAIQHTVGMKGASTIVSINKDANAPIFNISDYGLVGDLHEIVPALTAKVREVKG